MICDDEFGPNPPPDSPLLTETALTPEFGPKKRRFSDPPGSSQAVQWDAPKYQSYEFSESVRREVKKALGQSVTPVFGQVRTHMDGLQRSQNETSSAAREVIIEMTNAMKQLRVDQEKLHSTATDQDKWKDYTERYVQGIYDYPRQQQKDLSHFEHHVGHGFAQPEEALHSHNMKLNELFEDPYIRISPQMPEVSSSSTHYNHPTVHPKQPYCAEQIPSEHCPQPFAIPLRATTSSNPPLIHPTQIPWTAEERSRQPMVIESPYTTIPAALMNSNSQMMIPQVKLAPLPNSTQRTIRRGNAT